MISTVILEMHAATPRLYFHPICQMLRLTKHFLFFLTKRQKYIVEKLVLLTIIISTFYYITFN
jgi:hypothetical protein